MRNRWNQVAWAAGATPDLTPSARPEAQTASLRAHADARLRAAPQGEETWLQAKLLDQHADLLVIELSSYLYSGGAHGMPGRGLINYSLGEQRALGLQDILRPIFAPKRRPGAVFQPGHRPASGRKERSGFSIFEKNTYFAIIL